MQDMYPEAASAPRPSKLNMAVAMLLISGPGPIALALGLTVFLGPYGIWLLIPSLAFVVRAGFAIWLAAGLRRGDGQAWWASLGYALVTAATAGSVAAQAGGPVVMLALASLGLFSSLLDPRVRAHFGVTSGVTDTRGMTIGLAFATLLAGAESVVLGGMLVILDAPPLWPGVQVLLGVALMGSAWLLRRGKGFVLALLLHLAAPVVHVGLMYDTRLVGWTGLIARLVIAAVLTVAVMHCRRSRANLER